MCGIVGYAGGNKNVVSLLIDGLKKLEYRGYDSAGFCVSDGRKLLICKKKGKVAELEKYFAGDLRNKESGLFFGIAHTRWATHGEPSETNAHPHCDCEGKIAVVHNGIIENYQQLKESLKKEGHKFVSETDSEVVAHLLEKHYKENLEEALRKTLPCLKGSYALAAIHQGEEKIVVAKKDSPLMVGVGEGEMFLGSDAAAIMKNTQKAVYLEEDELAVITANGFTIRDQAGKKVERKAEAADWDLGQIEKGDHKHFMAKEISEQPEAIKNVLKGRFENRIILPVKTDIKKVKRVIITACGTSWHSALIGKYLLEKETGIPTEVDYASEFRYRDPVIKEGDLVVVISQSGETADTLAALREAKKKKAPTLGIVNVVGSTISREVDSTIYLNAGPEIGVASTKAFTCQVLVLLLFALYIKQEKGSPIDKKLIREIKDLPGKIKEALKEAANIKKIAKVFKGSGNFLYLGRGINFPVALEGALKLKEISYIHAEGYPAAEMKHGPIALVDEKIPALFVCPKDAAYEKIKGNMEEIKARKGRIIAVTNEDDLALNRLSEFVIKVPKVRDEFSPVINTIPLQLLAYYIADLKGIDVDKPRNLAKSVTVE